MKFYSTWVLFSIAGRIVEGTNDCKELYKSYFGLDYEFTEDYSLIVSNHTSWMDIMCYLHHIQCGFIAKDEVARIPIIGIIAQQMGGMFVKRDDAENRNLIVFLF
jgi:1-acyl-sn-glycerol-3-phosphate acyltransferase